MFSVNFMKFLRSFFYGTFPVAASLAPVVVDEHYIKEADSLCGKTHVKIDHKSRPHLLTKVLE